MSDKPLHYEMAPELAELVTGAGAYFADILATTLHDLHAKGAESNDAVSALAHWTGLFVSAGLVLIEARTKELHQMPLPPEAALDIFLEDVVRRVAERRSA